MCGRFYLDLKKLSEDAFLFELCNNMKLNDIAQNEVFPNSSILVMIQQDDQLCLTTMKWGIHNKYGHQINARIEGIEGRFYYKTMVNHRCLIPCHGFYEWKGKQKYYVTLSKETTCYLAGIYNELQECLILTKEAYDPIKSIHQRSPIIIQQSQIKAYFKEPFSSFSHNPVLTIKKIEDKPKHILQFSLFDENLI